MKLRTLVARGWVLAGLLVAAGCNFRQAYGDWVLEQPRPVVLGCEEEVSALALGRAVVVGEVSGGAGLSAYAGDISGEPNPIPVAFSQERPPLLVLREDLERMLAPAGSDALPDGGSKAWSEPLTLDVTLEVAYVHRTYHVLKSSAMVGGVVFDARLVEPGSGKTLWAGRVSGEHALRPTYISGESVERSLNAAYAQALARLGKALVAATGGP